MYNASGVVTSLYVQLCARCKCNFTFNIFFILWMFLLISLAFEIYITRLQTDIRINRWMGRPTDGMTDAWTMILSYTYAIDASVNDDFHDDFQTDFAFLDVSSVYASL